MATLSGSGGLFDFSSLFSNLNLGGGTGLTVGTGLGQGLTTVFGGTGLGTSSLFGQTAGGGTTDMNVLLSQLLGTTDIGSLGLSTADYNALLQLLASSGTGLALSGGSSLFGAGTSGFGSPFGSTLVGGTGFNLDLSNLFGSSTLFGGSGTGLSGGFGSTGSTMDFSSLFGSGGTTFNFFS